MKKTTKGHILYYAGLLVSVVAPLVAAATQFPVWTEEVEGGQIGGMFVFVAILCMIPVFNHLKITLKSPSSPLFGIIFFVIVWAFSKIINELLVVSLVYMIANIIGATMCAVGNKLRYGKWIIKEAVKEAMHD